jgi:hypothetical protein
MGCNCRGSVYKPQVSTASSITSTANTSAAPEKWNAASLTSPAKNKCYFVEIQGDYLALSAHNGQIFIQVPGQSTQQEIIGFLASCPNSAKTTAIVNVVSALYAKANAQEIMTVLSGINFTFGYLKTKVAIP